MTMKFDALVVGAGPAGLMAAETMARKGLSVVIAEAKPSPARKFLMAGKSGLNLTMQQPLDDFLSVYKNIFLAPMIRAFGPDEVRNFSHDLGQKTFVGSSRRVFPDVMKASPLLRAWMERLDGLGVKLHCNWRWLGFDNTFKTPEGTVKIDAKVTILALGGGSWARLGADGAWIDIFQNSHVATKCFGPSNMGIALPWTSHMKPFLGHPLKPIRLMCDGDHIMGECVISARGLEGSAIYALSSGFRLSRPLYADLMPDVSLGQVIHKLSKSRGKNTMANHLRKVLKLPDIKRALLREWGGVLPSDPIPLAHLIKSLPAPEYQTFPLDEAISTVGGVCLSALDETLMLISKPNVFCIGEMLDWDAPTGGYLITACLAMGKWAGIHAVKRV